jgi:hypothetical protein
VDYSHCCVDLQPRVALRVFHPTVCMSLSPVNEGFVGDPWLSTLLTLCHILHVHQLLACARSPYQQCVIK